MAEVSCEEIQLPADPESRRVVTGTEVPAAVSVTMVVSGVKLTLDEER